MPPPLIEVIARHRGRVIDVRHLRWTPPPALSPAALFGSGTLLAGAGLMFFRWDLGVSVVLLLLALLLLALAQIRWRDRPGTRYLIGEGAQADLTLALLPHPQRDAFPLVVALPHGAVLGLPPGAQGQLTGERSLDLGDALTHGRSSLALPIGGHARLVLGDLTFEIHTVELEVLERHQWSIDRLTWLSHIGAAVVLGALFLSLETAQPREQQALHDERLERVVRYLAAVEPPTLPPERSPQARNTPARAPARTPARAPARAPASLVPAAEDPPPRLAPEITPKLSSRASEAEIERAAELVAYDLTRQRHLARRKDGNDSEYDYDRVAGPLGNPIAREGIDNITIAGRAGMIAYAVTAEDDAWWSRSTSGPPSMAKHFGGLELAKTERGGGEHRDVPKTTAPKPVATELENPPPKQLTPQQEARIKRFVAIEVDPPSLQAGAGHEKFGLYAYVREHKAGLHACYNDALDNNPDLGGVAKLMVDFDATGTVTAASFAFTTLTIGEISPCLLRAVRLWRYPPAEPKPTKAVFHLQFKSYRR